MKESIKKQAKASPSSSRTSAAFIPTATAIAILCDSPPLRFAQARSQSSSEIPQDFATSKGCSASVRKVLSFDSLRELNDETVARNSRGVPCNREGL